MKWFKNSSYVYNPQTLTYEKRVVPVKRILLRGVGFLILVIVCSFAFHHLFSSVFPSFKYKALKVELNEMRVRYDKVNDQLDVMSAVLTNLQERDANVHRMIFGLKPLDSNVWHGGVGGHELYPTYEGYENEDILVSTFEKIDKLSRQLTMQSFSLDEIERLAADKEKYLNSIPSIKPVRMGKLKNKLQYLSGFGMRMHPIYKIPKMHAGLDFTAPTGTEIQASGDGVVSKVENKKNGYGRMILIDHGYGYKTLYAHLSEVLVRPGERITKGQTIGKVGNTGTSTAPHLHYEVHYKGKAVNPIDYVMDGLTPKEYNELVEKSKEANKSLD